MKIFNKLFAKKTVDANGATEKTRVITSQPQQNGIVQCGKINIDSGVLEKIKKRYIAFDVETTGLNPYSDRIIEVGAVLFENGEITASYGTLINPKVSVPQSATTVNQITNDMIKTAPIEIDVYQDLVQFLGDALDNETAICAHNAKFDMDFLSQTLIRMGYKGAIGYIDTLSLSRKLVKGLENHKQNTIALHFGINNDNSHRAVSDAAVCGKILWELIKLEIEECEQVRLQIEKSKPTNEELEVCAYIQDILLRNGGDAEWLRFSKNSGNYVDVTYCYSMFKFKSSKNGKYIIVEQNAIKNFKLATELCTESEGGTKNIRVYFNNPFDLEPLKDYFLKVYKHCRKSTFDYIGYGSHRKQRVLESISTRVALTLNEVESLLQSAEQRLSTIGTSNEEERKINKRNVQISRDEIIINPKHSRIPLTDIRNIGNWHKGYDEGHGFYEEGEIFRKKGVIDKAIILYDKARYNGYDAPALYTAYAMAYRQLKDYENEIAILDEAIVRTVLHSSESVRLSEFESRRYKAIQLFFTQQESQKIAEEKISQSQKKAENKKSVEEKVKLPRGRAIIQMSDDRTIIQEFASISEAVQKTKINSKSIRDAANGVQKHAGGFVWLYTNKND
jgi:DNA polymerase III epsilon subunit family exonuclease